VIQFPKKRKLTPEEVKQTKSRLDVLEMQVQQLLVAVTDLASQAEELQKIQSKILKLLSDERKRTRH
jgi:hypothetical protein